MNKSAIQKFAIQARNDLIAQVKQQAFNYGIDENGYGDENSVSVNGVVLSDEKVRQRKELIRKIKESTYELVMEKVAYTWFNRFIALRFMEVNDYLPTHIRVLSNDNGEFKPAILQNALSIELTDKNGKNLLDKKRVEVLLDDAEGTEDLYRYLLLTQCNFLHDALPQMFEKMGGYTELLLPLKILSDDSVLAHLVNDIEEDDFRAAVEILGWMYQYYNTEPKADVFAGLKKNIKITKENIPAATQLFTPDWIVRYMVENSLGRIAVDKLDLDPKVMNWKYYLEEAEQTEEVKNQLAIINGDKKDFKLEELKVIDPCMGSGHILVYAFDVLMQIYESQGYTSRDAVASIMENNLFGLDIDERAYQLSYFALMMKARANDRRFLTREISPQVYCPKGYADGEEYGSLLNVDELEEMPKEKDEITLFDESYEQQLNTWNFRRLLNQKYDVVVTNPPYMGSKGMSAKLSKYVQDNYADSKSDLFAVFIEKTLEMAKKNGYSAMITQHAFMFLSSYEKLRTKLLHTDIINMAHLGARAFEEIGGEVVQTTSWVMRKSNLQGYKGTYARLVDFNSQQEKEDEFLTHNHLHKATQENFSKIPGSPVAYWVSEQVMEIFSNASIIEEVATPKQGFATTDNDRFLRYWFEIKNINLALDLLEHEQIKPEIKWVPYNKGGAYKKWYGNNDYVCYWENAGSELKNHKSAVLRNLPYQFKKSITWSLTNSSYFGARCRPSGSLFDTNGMSLFAQEEVYNYLLGFMCSKNASLFMRINNPTLASQVGDIARLPIIIDETKKDQIDKLVEQNISLSKTDWDSLETSWDFGIHPFIQIQRYAKQNHPEAHSNCEKLISDCYGSYTLKTAIIFENLKKNEEKLNRIFIDIYGLQDELTPEVADKDVTVRLADKTRDIKSFISYAVGCMFGRYSLGIDGLAFAGGEFDSGKYTTFTPDVDNIIPICDDEYFEDDIVGRFIKFVEVVYGQDTLNQNLEFIAEALGGKGTPEEVIRNYFVKDFYNDHVKTYSKRPIYWQFDSGKKNGFKALIYMHRYESNLLARMRTDYVHEQQERYRTQLTGIEDEMINATPAEKTKLTKQHKKLSEQLLEIGKYEEKVHHIADQNIAIDLDDGVVKNYALFSDVVTKIK